LDGSIASYRAARAKEKSSEIVATATEKKKTNEGT
jgi:hypothetical protein